MNAKDIVAEIITGRFDANEINSILDAIKFARAKNGRENFNTLRIGDVVEFRGRRGEVIRAVVQKFMQKNLSAKCQKTGIFWRVPAGACKKVS